MKFWSILTKPNHLDELAKGDASNRKHFWNDVQWQIRVLHLLGRSYMVFITTVVCLTSTHLALPFMYGDNGNQLFAAQLLMYYLCVSGLVNFICVMVYANKSRFSSGFSRELPISASKGIQPPDWSRHVNSSAGDSNGISDWRKCQHCEINVPPRARHCAICQTCVLKRDHHCFFTACCIGFHNQRFFIAMAFFGMTAGLWGAYNFVTYLNSNYAVFFSLSIYRYFLPYCFISVTLGYMSLVEFGLVFLFYIQVSSSTGAGYYFWWQMFITYRGQSSVEALKRTKLFDRGPMENFRSTLGPVGFLGVVFPIPYIILDGDGLTWNRNRKVA